MMQANAALAVRTHPELDYSEDSLVLLDHILDRLHNQQPGRMTEEQLNSACNLYGAYLGEFLVRQLQGEWILSSEFDNEPAVQAGTVKILTAFPFDKVYKRITNGPIDEIAYYYKAMKHALVG